MTRAVEDALETLDSAAYCKDEGITSGPLGVEIRRAATTLAAHIAAQEAEIARLREALERIANQGPHYGPDGTYKSWVHWMDIAAAALEAK